MIVAGFGLGGGSPSAGGSGVPSIRRGIWGAATLKGRAKLNRYTVCGQRPGICFGTVGHVVGFGKVVDNEHKTS